MNPWKILGVNRQNTPEEIHSAYLKLARQHHPDVTKDEGKFSVITGAYAVLRCPENQRNFLKQMRTVNKDCDACTGKGAVFKQRSLTGRVALTCKTCEGAGYVIKEKKK